MTGRPRVRFDVNDAALRERFLSGEFQDGLALLRADAAAQWGRMTPQQMVEHLEWTFLISTGELTVECPTPESQLELYRRFLYSNRRTPTGFENPLLVDGLPPLRHPTLEEAKRATAQVAARFLGQLGERPETVRVHPLFGPIALEGWSRTHYKHCVHHLSQFGLLDVDYPPAP